MENGGCARASLEVFETILGPQVSVGVGGNGAVIAGVECVKPGVTASRPMRRRRDRREICTAGRVHLKHLNEYSEEE